MARARWGEQRWSPGWGVSFRTLILDPDPDPVGGRRRGLGSSGVAASRPAPTAVADPAATPGLAPA